MHQLSHIIIICHALSLTKSILTNGNIFSHYDENERIIERFFSKTQKY